LSFKQLLTHHHEAEWTPLQTHYFSENQLAPGFEPGTSGTVATNSGHYTTEAVHIIKVTSKIVLFSRTALFRPRALLLSRKDMKGKVVPLLN
jgi:hypothetical protein